MSARIASLTTQLAAACLLLAASWGCRAVHSPDASLAVRGQSVVDPIVHKPFVPRELDKISLPTYRIEPPDILLIDAVRVIPKAPYQIEPLDVLQIVVEGTPPEQTIAGLYGVGPGGMVDLGPAYGSVQVAGLTIEEARTAIDRHLRAVLRDPQVSVSLAQTVGQQQIVGEHLVGMDGTVNLGVYGAVYVAGMTLQQARTAIEQHLDQYLETPRVSVDVFAYNSKVYYVITEGAGLGDRVVRAPVTGNETVLDAISLVGGLTQLSSKRIWIARPAPSGFDCDQILPVNWIDITRGAATATNYQILPGDRVFIAEDRLVAFDTLVNKVTSPIERMFGFTLLGVQTIQAAQRFPGGFPRSNTNPFF